MIVALCLDLGVQLLDLPFFVCALRRRNALFHFAVPARVLDLLACADDGKLFEAQVDSDSMATGRFERPDFDWHVDVPPALRVLGERASAEGLSFGQFA